MLLGIAIVAALLFYNRGKLFGKGGMPGPVTMEPGAIDYPELVPSNTVPNQIRTSIQGQLMQCLTANENDSRAQPNCIQYAQRAYARAVRAYATGATTPTLTPATPAATGAVEREWTRGDRGEPDRDQGRDWNRDEEKERGSTFHHERHHRKPHKWSRDRRYWWSNRHRRWRGRHERDDDEDDDHRGGHDRWGRPRRKGWRRNECREEFHGRCDSECEHGPGGRCMNCIHACGRGWFGFKGCTRFWSWHWGPCGPPGFPWWKPRHHRHRHYWSHDRRRWWDDRHHNWRNHNDRDDDRGGWGGGRGREGANVKTAQDYGLTYYQKDFGLDYMRGR